MGDFFQNMAASTRDLFRQAHTVTDVDEDPQAMHHTLGKAPTQAAPGNHSHYYKGVTEGSIDPLLELPNDGTIYDVYLFSAVTVPSDSLTHAAVATVTVFFNARAQLNAACNWYLMNGATQIDFHRNHNNSDQYMNMGATLTGTVDVRQVAELNIVVQGANDSLSGTGVLCGPAHISVGFA